MIELTDAQRDLLYSKDEFSVEEVAEILGCSIYTVRRKIKDGSISADGGAGRGGYRIPYMSINLYIAMVNGDMNAIYETDSKEASHLAAALEIVPRSVRLLEWINEKIDYADDPMAVQATLKACEVELCSLKGYYNDFMQTKPNPRNWGKLIEEAQSPVHGKLNASSRISLMRFPLIDPGKDPFLRWKRKRNRAEFQDRISLFLRLYTIGIHFSQRIIDLAGDHLQLISLSSFAGEKDFRRDCIVFLSALILIFCFDIILLSVFGKRIVQRAQDRGPFLVRHI